MTTNSIELITKNTQKVALRGIRVHSHLTAMGQRTTIEQMFINPEKKPIEVTYVFPVPERAAVCGFEVITGERVLTGQVEETEKASEMYESAISRGDAAYGLHQHRPDVFSIDVGNLKPGQMALVRITYVSELEVTDGRIRLAYPTVVAPRYATATGTDPLQALHDANVLNPPHLLQVPYGLSLQAEISLGRPIRMIQSPSHQIDVQTADENEYRVTLAGGLTETNREIVLELNLGEEQEPRAEAAVGSDGQAYVAVTFVPDLQEPGTPEPSEVVFVLDCSGSMQGTSVEQAKIALDLCLRNLSDGDLFNICRFGSTFEWMTPEPLVYSQETLQKAAAYVEHIDADLGGTELYPALESFLKRRPCVGATRQVILLTDGEVSNEPAVIALARKHRDRNRAFTFGIGPACSRYLVRGIAEATRGAAEFITEDERIEDKVLRTFSRLASPALTDLKLEWHMANAVEQAPAALPPLFEGDAVSIYARCPADRVPAQATLSCAGPRGRQAWTIDIHAAAGGQQALPLLWARRVVQDLEDGADDQESRVRLIEISKRYGLLCSQTSFIAIEHRTPEERNDGRPATRRVPVQIPRGWHGIDIDFSAASRQGIDMCSVGEGIIFSRDRSEEADFSHLRLVAVCGEAFSTPAPQDTALGGLTLLLRKQQADGHFEFCDEAAVPGWTAAQEKAAEWLAQAGSTTTAPADRLAPTVAALLILHKEFADQQRIWKRAAEKAVRYVAKALEMTADDVMAAIQRLQAVG